MENLLRLLRSAFVRMQSYATLNFILGGLFGWAIQESANAISQQQRWLGFGAILLFVIVAFAVAPPIETLIRSFFRPTLPPMGEKPQPRRGLILLFSNEKTALCAIDHHAQQLAYVLCVVTEFMEERFNQFRLQLLARGLQVHPQFMDDAYDQREAAAAVLNCIAWARTKQLFPDDLICDVTGGTSIMSIGAALACQRQGIDVQMVKARQTDKGPEPLHPVLIRFDLHEANQPSQPKDVN